MAQPQPQQTVISPEVLKALPLAMPQFILTGMGYRVAESPATGDPLLKAVKRERPECNKPRRKKRPRRLGDADPVGSPMCCHWAGCKYATEDLENLRAHLNTHTSASSDFVCQWDNCPRKGQAFSNRSGLFRHLKYHIGDKPCKCHYEGCDFCSVDNGELSRHVKIVHEKKY